MCACRLEHMCAWLYERLQDRICFSRSFAAFAIATLMTYMSVCVFAYACLRIQEGAWMCMYGYIWLYVHYICSCTYVFFSLDMNICRFWKQIYLSVHICRGQVLPPSDAQSSVIGRLWHSEPPKPPVHPIRTRHLRYRATLVLVPNKFWSSLLTWLP